MTRDEARGWLVEMLLDKIRSDPYPSSTQLTIIEEVLPRELIPDYLDFNPSKEQVEEERAKARERMAKKRGNKK